MRTIVPAWFIALSLIAFSCPAAVAAPQVLAVLAAEDGVSLTCTDGRCEAELSAFCLQRARPAPDFAAEYAPAARDQFALVISDASGRERRLPATPHLRFSESRSFTAVVAHLPEARLASLGAVSARVAIGPNASLVPMPVAGDPDPQTPAELRHATGSGRALAARIVDAGPRGAAARVLGAMINGLPREGREDRSRYDALWERASGAAAAGSSDSGMRSARSAFNACVRAIEDGATYRLRGCLSIHHDKIMRDLSVKYWNAGAGS